ncbi:MAG: Autotransporter beta-domain, partial [Verrucomicrobiota bacterium]
AGTSKPASLAVAGTDYDSLHVTGTLDVSGASAANPITIRIFSLAHPTDVAAGNAVGFDTMKLNHFAFATVGNLAQGASPLADIFSYDLANFTDSTGGTSDPTRWAMSYEGGVLWLTASPQLLSYGVLAPGNAPGLLSIADINLTSRGTFEISKLPQIGGYYNDTVEFTGKANLNPAPGSEIALARYTPTGEIPDYGRRFVLFKGVGTPATDPSLVSSYFINPAPASVVNLDPETRYLVVGPAAVDAGATASAYDGLVHNADGLVHLPNEYAVYLVRGASGYVQPGVGLGLTGYVQEKALTLAGQPLELGGTVYVPGALDPLVARLMTMGDPMLASAMASLEPADYAAIPATLALGQRNQTAALYRLLEPRHLAGSSFAQGLQGFFQVAGSNFRTTAGTDRPTFNTNVGGGMAGMMTEVGAGSSAGFSFSYSDARSTPLRGGSINGHAYHATAFVSSHVTSPVGELFLDAGATFGASHNKAIRKTFLGTETASPIADAYGAFARVGTQRDMGQGLSFRPYAGLDTSKVNGQGFQETGDLAALKVNRYSYASTRATLGAGVDWSGLEEGRGWRFSLDVEAYRELGGGKTVDFTGSFADGVEWTSRANVADPTGFRLAPSLNFSPDAQSSYYLNLSFEKAGPTKTTGFELGYRRRF